MGTALKGVSGGAAQIVETPGYIVAVCDLCGSTLGEVRFWATDHREGLGGRFAIVECADCGLVRTEPQPEDVAAWYPESYRNHAARPSVTVRAINTALGYCGSPARNEIVATLVGWVIPNAVVGAPLIHGARILDVGAGNGTAVAALRARGHDAWGLEPSPEGVAAARAQGVDTVVKGTLDHAPLAGKEWDMIRFTHVLEHVRSPVTTLRIARRMLAPGGRIVILVPNFDGAGRRLFGRSWDGLEVPRHLHHFTKQSLERTLAAAGLCAGTTRTVALMGVTPASLDAWTCRGEHQRGWGRNLLVRAAWYPVDLMVAAAGLGEGLLAVATLDTAEDSR